MLQARDIHARLGGKPILHGIEFTAHDGQLTAIVGPNGSGKSTLLKALTGEIDSTGQLHLNGHDIRRLKPWQLAGMRAVLPQAATLAFPFQVIEVVRIGLRSGTAGQRDRLPELALAAVGLDGYAPRLYQELSGGEQQRAQLARVLCQVWEPVEDDQPRWLLLDEPVASLDIGHQLQVMTLLRDYARRGGGVVAVMHDLNLSAMFADRMTVMARGRVTATGSPREVMTDATLSQTYNCPLRVNAAPEGQSFLLPHMAG